MFDRLWLRIGYIVTVTRLLVASLFDKALHEFVVPWSLSYLLSWRGGSTGNNPRLIFLPQKFTFKLRPQEPKQRILHCESASRSFTPCVLASAYRAPKQWCLSKVGTIYSFENWKQNRLYTLSLDSNFVSSNSKVFNG